MQNKNLDRGFSEFGGWTGSTGQRSFVPTGETALFILAGDDLAKRFELAQLFDEEHRFATDGILSVDNGQRGEPFLSGPLRLGVEWLNLLIRDVEERPEYSIHFPASRLTTNLAWEDLVLSPSTRAEIEYILTWIKKSETLMDDWGLEKVIKPGYRALFYGPPGTGKSLTAALIGVKAERDVYRIDLSMVVSKYIGETEENLASVFNQAERKNWILFFDEADALFGRRTTTSSSNDRYANQEVSYLLKRIEDSHQVVILATNMKSNIDDAFARRFQGAVFFPMPNAEQRQQLWESSLPIDRLSKDVDLEEISEQHELAGGGIVSVVRHAAITAIQRAEDSLITERDLLRGIARERGKQGLDARSHQ